MKKGQIIEGVVTEVLFPNKGIVETEEGIVTVKNVLPSQKVRAVIQKKRKGKCEGRLLEVLEPASEELETAQCPHFGECGGCAYQNLAYETQLALKEQQVRRLLDGVLPEGEYVFEGVKPSPGQFAYRNKMEFTFGDRFKDGPLALGMHKRGSFYDIVTVNNCRIVDEDYRKILRCVRDYFDEKHISFYHRMRHTGYLRHLLVRKAVRTEEILLDLVTTSPEALILADFGGEALPQVSEEQHSEAVRLERELLDGMTDRLRALELLGNFAGILHTKNDSVADVIKDEGTEILYGNDYFYEELLGLKFQISPFSFFQTNSLGAELLYETARDYIGDTLDQKADKVVFDLYSGTGTIAQMLSPVAKRVVGVEIVEEAVCAARENAKRNGLTNCEFIAGDVLKVLDEISDRPDFIVLDPPRDGIHPKALDKIIDYGVERMVYISCKPTSLVRDLEVLLARGYRVERVCCVDMFPGTTHVETVVLLPQRKADDYVEVELELDEFDVTSAESKATYKEIQEYVLKEHGLKVSNLYISQVKRKCGIEVGENYNLPKTEDSRQPQCPEEKEKAIRDALEHFGMV